MLSVFSLLARVIGSEDIDWMLLGSPLFSLLLVIIVIIEETYCFHGRHPSGSQSSRRSFPLQQPLHLSGAHKDMMIIIPISFIIQYPIDIWHPRHPHRPYSKSGCLCLLHQRFNLHTGVIYQILKH